ncbi:MAG: TIGR02996 domain-containing protein [Planctomycetaceae bacterium]|nr:TIGR02996 domain-containing protein [Planctomycetaceae bacterium]
MHEQQHRAFLDILEKNEDDSTTRLIYADWLEEWGYCEEAERQRLWPQAKKWLVEFCEKNQGDEYEWKLDYETLLEEGNRAYQYALEKDGEIGVISLSCGNNETMCYALRANPDEFWKNWSIITGNPLPDEPEGNYGFRCAC